MKEIIESYFRERSLVNHQLASYNDCIPTADSQSSRFERIVRNIRIGTDEAIEDEDGGITIYLIKHQEHHHMLKQEVVLMMNFI